MKKKTTQTNKTTQNKKVKSGKKNGTIKKVVLADLEDKKLSELEPVVLDAGRRYKVVEYIEFVKWTALPTSERDPKNQGGFSKRYKVNQKTLSQWKASPEFWDDVSRIRKAYMQNDFAEIIKALTKNIIKNGKGQDVKVYAQIAGVMREDGDGVLALSPALENAISKIGKRLPD